MRIPGNKIFGFGIDVCKIAASAAGNNNFAPDLRIVFQNKNFATAFSRLLSAKKSSRARADNNYVEFHFKSNIVHAKSSRDAGHDRP